ncbi:MAG: hypothetical protein HN368_11100 [Spirochaetales bacterium]|jgi:hypothetical protein|nr:hypothetical protein [Spirochaetales bacterium]
MENNITLNSRDSGYRGIWYFNQPSGDEFAYKYSGGLGTYCAKHRPIAIYRPEVDKTFFCYGGCDTDAHLKYTTDELADGHAFERSRPGMLKHMIGFYDHAHHSVPRPTVLLDKGTADAHDNPVMAIDDQGYIWVFSTSHGASRPSYIHKSARPYSIDEFELVPAEWDGGQGIEKISNFSYMQPWFVPGRGFIAFLTRYHNPVVRTIGYITSGDGFLWSAWKPLAIMSEGHYQVSEVWSHKDEVRAGTAFNYHPGSVNLRTNLYYMETRDFGTSWHTVSGTALELPLDDIESEALVFDFASEGKLIYMKDISYDASGRPVILYVESTGYESGPGPGARRWMTAGWNGSEWELRRVTDSDNNYDTGCLHIQDDETWMVIGPTEVGPQPYNPGGEIAMWRSDNRGLTWSRLAQLTSGSERNHTYARRPLNAHPDFLAMWADGNPRKPSISRLHFAGDDGKVYRLPLSIHGENMAPERLDSSTITLEDG